MTTTRYALNWQIGKNGQDLALAHLIAAGFKHVASNYSCRLGEIDLVVAKHDLLAFVEVKTRQKNSDFACSGLVGAQKQRRISLAAKHFIANNLAICQDKALRFDVCLVFGDPEFPSVQHVQNAFYSAQP